MKDQIGNGIYSSIGNFFSNKFNAAKNYFTGPKVQNIPMKNMKNNVPKPPVDYGYKYDNQPPGYVPPPKSTFDRIADKVAGFDKGINNLFDYSSPSGGVKKSPAPVPSKVAPGVAAYKQQKLGYGPNGFLQGPEDF